MGKLSKTTVVVLAVMIGMLIFVTGCDGKNYTDAAIAASISDSVEDESADKSLSARQGAFLYEMVTNVNDRENKTWRTVSTYIPYLEHYATNNYKAARIANERVGKLEKWRRDEEETKRRLSEALQSLDSGSSSVSNVIEALKSVLVRPEFDKTHSKSLIENKKGK